MKRIKQKFQKLFYLIKKAIYFAWYRHHFLIPPSALIKYMKSFFNVLKRSGTSSDLFFNQKAYLEWREKNQIEVKYQKFKYNPLISIIIPTYNVSKDLLSECLDSILNQSYKNFEICICDDKSTNEETIKTLKEYQKKDKRIKVIFRKENGMISASSNDAIKIAKGEFLVLVDNDDTIDKDALYHFVSVLNKDKTIDLIYSDEDKIDMKGNYLEPHFKPDFSPDTFLGMNYICHLVCLRKKIVLEIGGFRSEYDGSQDYDLLLRFIEKTKNIYHLDKILYHWRQSPNSTSTYLGNKSYAYIAGKKALLDYFKRNNINALVLDNKVSSTYLIKYLHDNPKVSIIIPMKDKVELTKTCVDSLINKVNYKNYEIIIVNNNSVLDETYEFFKEYKEKYKNFKVLDINEEFNYSRLNNQAVKISKGEYILLLNNDTEVLDPNFLDEMVGYASQEHVGCVGLKLLYKDKKVQHAGVVLSYGGVAGHVFVTSNHDDKGLFNRLSMPYDYSAVTAACLMVKKDKYLMVDGLDENLKVALNDVDFNLKLLKKGYYNVCLNHVTMYHYESRSRGYEVSKEKQERFLQESLYMKNKWKDFLLEDKFFSKNNF